MLMHLLLAHLLTLRLITTMERSDRQRNLKQRTAEELKNVKYILDKMSNAKHMSSWTSSGEFVFKGQVINGSHVLDLVKV